MTVLLELREAADTLRYRIQVHKALPQEDLRVVVPVTALIQTRDHDQAALHRQIREALNALIPAEWAFSRIERGGDAAGYERVQLNATARVKASENYDLAERARRAGREGLSLGQPRVDYALSVDKVDEVVGQLRLEVLRRVKLHIADFDRETGREWRIGDIAFGIDLTPEQSGARTSKGAYRDIGEVLGSLDDEGLGAALAGAERIKLIATVTLRTDAPDAWHSADG